MKRILLSGLILMTTGLFSNGAWARCCGDGGKPCYPMCIAATETGWMELAKNHDNNFNQKDEDTFDFQCSRSNPRSGAQTCCAYKNGNILYCTTN